MVYGLQDVIMLRQMLSSSEAIEQVKRLEQRKLEAMLDCIEQADRVGVSPVSCYELALAQQRGRLELPRAVTGSP